MKAGARETMVDDKEEIYTVSSIFSLAHHTALMLDGRGEKGMERES